jgi:hypothetical protein
MQELKKRIISNNNFPSKINLLTSTSRVECYVCGKGVKEGHPITAKTLPSGIVLFCNIHFPS